MAVSRRKESFRYEFSEKIESPFSITEINGKQYNSKEAIAKLIDLSPNGCRIESFLNLNASNNNINVVVKFNLIDQNIEVDGRIVWQRSTTYCHYYGVEFVKSSEGDQAYITDYLKSYTKNNKIHSIAN